MCVHVYVSIYLSSTHPKLFNFLCSRTFFSSSLAAALSLLRLPGCTLSWQRLMEGCCWCLGGWWQLSSCRGGWGDALSCMKKGVFICACPSLCVWSVEAFSAPADLVKLVKKKKEKKIPIAGSFACNDDDYKPVSSQRVSLSVRYRTN